MHVEDLWGERWFGNENEVARKYMKLVIEKQSPLVLAADKNKISELWDLLEEVSRSVVVLKTHVDLVEDFDRIRWREFVERARELDVLIFEDRKFADIAKISKTQMSGGYEIARWADLVTAHLISGPDIINGLIEAWSDIERKGGVLLLAQMSSKGNLLDDKYTQTVVDLGSRKEDDVAGYIGNGSDIEQIMKLRSLIGGRQLIWTPGINFSGGEGEKGQRYGDPLEAIIAGSDAIIVGSGIHRANSPAIAAKEYADAGWNGLLSRGQTNGF